MYAKIEHESEISNNAIIQYRTVSFCFLCFFLFFFYFFIFYFLNFFSF